MASPLEVQLILCDAAQGENGKIHMLGAGWSVRRAQPTPHAVAVLVKVPWDRANQKLQVNLQLENADGVPVTFSSPDGQKVKVRGQGTIEVGRPPGVAEGSLLDASFSLNVGPLPLKPGRYQWRLSIAEETKLASFQVLPN